MNDSSMRTRYNLSDEEFKIAEEIREFLIERSKEERTNDTSIGRRLTWKKINPVWEEFVFSRYDKAKEFFHINCRDFLDIFFLNKTPDRVCFSYEDVIRNIHSQSLIYYNKANKNSKKATQVKTAIKHVEKRFNFKTDNASELQYCLVNNIKERPVCKECQSRIEYNSPSYGFRDFCSAKCQNTNNNAQKEIRKSNLTDDEIRDLISKVSLDHRNLTEEVVAANFINMQEYVKSQDIKIDNLQNREIIYIFMMRLKLKDIICPVCKTNKRQFISQGRGHRVTCGDKECQLRCVSVEYAPQDRVYKFSTNKRLCDLEIRSYSEEDIDEKEDTVNYRPNGFIYILHSENLGLYKIGITKNPTYRFAELQRAIPDLEIIEFLYCKKNLEYIERTIHTKFRNQRILVTPKFNGYTEFFELSDNDLQEVEEFINANRK